MEKEFSFQARDTRLKDILFSTSKYKIPRYQRSYTWNEDQLSDFWSDLVNNDKSYFIGSFILNKESLKETGYIDVIDGQQRILTSTIFLAALRDLLKGISDQNEDDAKKISELIQTQDIAMLDRNGNESYRIVCGDSTKAFFEKNIQNKVSEINMSDPKTIEETLIKKNYEYFNQKITAELNNRVTQQSKIAYLQELREKIAELIVIEITIESEEDAYEIFETTNARGVELSVADLLKNLIFKKIPKKKDKDTAKELWNDIVANITETNTDLKRFLRYYWISKYSFVTEKKLFKEIKKEITDWEQFLNDLHKASEHWFNLMQGSEDDWKSTKNGLKVLKNLKSIKIMNVTQCYVLFLSILRNADLIGIDFSKIFNLIEKFTFQYSVICKKPGNNVEKIYSKYARKIEQIIKKETKKNISKRIQSTFEELKKELTDVKPFYEEFKENFMEIEYGRSERTRIIAKYILDGINNLSENGEHSIDFMNVNAEHILPQNPDSAWNLTKKEIKNYVDKLGNLTLVHKKFNSTMGNSIIKEKINELKRSNINMNKELVEFLEKNGNHWTEKEILERQLEFADKAYNKCWSL
jgi:uncharacterized protein with ParB-like and HNH nuclease domain